MQHAWDQPPAIVRVAGDFDVYTAPGVREELLAAMRWQGEQGPRHVIVDLDDADHVDAPALGVLMGAHYRLLERGGGVLLVSTHERHRRLHRLTGIAEPVPPVTKGIPLYDSVEQALTAAQQDRPT
ncbi:STAS domain-containing protein [Actinomadura sp. NPDC048032]|uniref:STAS domain-containing protein n=1 Tax=Actinomadura sp. NPDC048032 TaxID=3155747 RepID=UPI0033DFDE30